jgi:hypothetical protein
VRGPSDTVSSGPGSAGWPARCTWPAPAGRSRWSSGRRCRVGAPGG